MSIALSIAMGRIATHCLFRLCRHGALSACGKNDTSSGKEVDEHLWMLTQLSGLEPRRDACTTRIHATRLQQLDLIAAVHHVLVAARTWDKDAVHGRDFRLQRAKGNALVYLPWLPALNVAQLHSHAKHEAMLVRFVGSLRFAACKVDAAAGNARRPTQHFAGCHNGFGRVFVRLVVQHLGVRIEATCAVPHAVCTELDRRAVDTFHQRERCVQQLSSVWSADVSRLRNHVDADAR